MNKNIWLSTLSALLLVTCNQTNAQAAPASLQAAMADLGALSSCESKILLAISAGQIAECGAKISATSPDSLRSSERSSSVRASLLRRVVVNKELQSQIDPNGIRVVGAFVRGTLDLSYSSVTFPISIQ